MGVELLDEETLGRMAGEITTLMRGRPGFPDSAGLATQTNVATTKNGAQVQVLISDREGKALLSVSVELCTPEQATPQLTLVNRFHH